ncbi:MAG: alanine/glycine:cation symporter family protein [Lishizhenia sp.]
MKSLILVFSFLISSPFLFAQQELSAKMEIKDSLDKIDDVQVKVSVQGGTAPYRYFWSESKVSIYNNQASGLPEGKDITVKVVDAVNDTVTVSGRVEEEGFAENVNSIMKPAVGVLSDILFFPLWKDTIKVKENVMKAPFALDKRKTDYKIKKWLVQDGQSVEHLEAVALLEDGGKDLILYAVGKGKVELLAKAGEDVFFKNKRGNRSEKKLLRINYDTPQPLYNKNMSTNTQGLPLIVVWLVLGAVFFTIKMKFINFKGAKHAIQLVQGKFDDPNDKGEVSHFQALVTALSGTVGLGNIAGVAIAVSAGGPGATFWMIVAGLIGMATKFVECTLGVKYREINEHGEVSGGPMYYLSKGLKKKGLVKLGKVLAIMFAVLCVGGSFGGGNMFQANQAFNQLASVPGWEWMQSYGVVFGLILAALVGIVIIGGIKSIANVTDKIVPVMVGMYVISALVIIGINITSIGDAFGTILSGAFSPDAVYGGFIGVLILGFQRAAFSNEAGVGSASIAHSAAKTDEHVSEGTVALLEPFIDTVVVCTMTALVIIFTGYAADPEGLEGASLTSAAFSSSLGDWSIYVLAFAAVLFAFSTMISWSYYGLKAWTYMFGKNKTADYVYKALFLLFVVVGSSIGLGAVLDFSDLMILGMAFPNILGLLILSGEVKADMKDYFERIKSGAIARFK